MPSTMNAAIMDLVRKLSHTASPDAYKRLRSGTHDDTIPLLLRADAPGQEQKPEAHVHDEKILCTADRLAVGMGLEYKKREVVLKRASSNAGAGAAGAGGGGGYHYGRAGGGGRAAGWKK